MMGALLHRCHNDTKDPATLVAGCVSPSACLCVARGASRVGQI
jgi:hypothetical protein